jgi:hypothetical protein
MNLIQTKSHSSRGSNLEKTFKLMSPLLKTVPLAIKLMQDAACYDERRMAKRNVGGSILLAFADKLSGLDKGDTNVWASFLFFEVR